MSLPPGKRRPCWQPWVMLGLLAGILLTVVAMWPSNSRPDRVDDLDYRSDGFYARVSPSDHYRPGRWVRSIDGGLTWTGVDEDAVPRVAWGRTENPRCAGDGVCYRRNDEGYSVERGDDHHGWTVEYASAVILTELAVNPRDSAQAMLIVDWERILRRAPDGTWSVVDVAAATSPPVWQVILDAVQRSQLALVGVGALLCLLGGRRYGAAGRARGIWIGLNVLVGVGLTHFTFTAQESLARDAGVWLAVGLAILAMPVPRRAPDPAGERLTEQDLR